MNAREGGRTFGGASAIREKKTAPLQEKLGEKTALQKTGQKTAARVRNVVRKNDKGRARARDRIGGGDDLSLPGSLSNIWCLHVGLKVRFVRWVWGLILVTIVLVVMDPYSIDRLGLSYPSRRG